jgi:hypothetical protein
MRQAFGGIQKRLWKSAAHGTAATPVCVLNISVFIYEHSRAEMNTPSRDAESGNAFIPSDFSIFLPLRFWPASCYPKKAWDKHREQASRIPAFQGAFR